MSVRDRCDQGWPRETWTEIIFAIESLKAQYSPPPAYGGILRIHLLTIFQSVDLSNPC